MKRSKRDLGNPAFYARSTGTGGWRDWVAILHLPYTAWHLSYVVIGATLANTSYSWTKTAMTLLIFFLGMGIAAHALDELKGRPLKTGIPAIYLIIAAILSTVAAASLGIGFFGIHMVPLALLGIALMVVYNLELFGGLLHKDIIFALAWGTFPFLTAFYAQTGTLSVAVVVGGAGAFGLSLAQRALSIEARQLRRNVSDAALNLTMNDGSMQTYGSLHMVTIYERILLYLTWSVIATALCALLLHIH